MNILFCVSGAIAVIAALLVITGTNAARAVVFLVAAFLATASVFYTLGAPFIAVLQIIIYAGAIIVLFVFVVMILNLSEAESQERTWLKWPVWVIPLVLAIILTAQFVSALTIKGHRANVQPAGAALQSQTLDLRQPSPAEVGRSLYTNYIIGVELASMLLLSALVAAFHLGYMPNRGEAGDEHSAG